MIGVGLVWWMEVSVVSMRERESRYKMQSATSLRWTSKAAVNNASQGQLVKDVLRDGINCAWPTSSAEVGAGDFPGADCILPL